MNNNITMHHTKKEKKVWINVFTWNTNISGLRINLEKDFMLRKILRKQLDDQTSLFNPNI